MYKEKQVTSILDDNKFNPEQKALNRIMNHVRAIVEVCPRGQDTGKVEQWRSTVEATLQFFQL